MIRQFKIGDVCEIVRVAVTWLQQDASLIGLECTIETALMPPGTAPGYVDGGFPVVNKHPVYGIKLRDGRGVWCVPEALRLKKPPPEVSTWDAIEKLTRWNPTKVGEPA